MLTDDEIAVLMNADMNLENLLSVRILLATGVRISELNNALKANVHLEEKRWHIPKTKTGNGYFKFGGIEQAKAPELKSCNFNGMQRWYFQHDEFGADPFLVGSNKLVERESYLQHRVREVK